MAYGDDNSQLRAVHELAPLGNPPGNIPQKYAYFTNDTASAVETNGYFDGVLNDGLKANDIIAAYMDIDGTPVAKEYLVTVGGADVTVAAILQDTDT